jgi:hypothetical protein
MPLELNLPETAKALSAPVTKLIEVVAAGCGAVYESTGIRRRANAQADALLVMEEAKARASEISRRAAQRVLDVEERRQRNIDAITAEAIQRLPPEVSADPVDPDWSARFFAECQDVSNDEMQGVWARLLAGEVARPGSFSPRTLWIVKNLSANEAQLFNSLCKNSFRLGTTLTPLVGSPPDSPFFEELGLNFPAFQALEHAGLIAHHALGLVWDRKREHYLLVGSGVSLLLTSKNGVQQFSVGTVSFTPAGLELSTICEWNISDARITEVEMHLVPKFSSEHVKVVGLDANGHFEYAPLDKG